MFHMRPNVACECISTRWVPVHLFPSCSQEPTPCLTRDLWAYQNDNSVLWNQWVSADAGHRGNQPVSHKQLRPYGWHHLGDFITFSCFVKALSLRFSSSPLQFNFGLLNWPLGLHLAFRVTLPGLSSLLDHLGIGDTPPNRGVSGPGTLPQLWLFISVLADSSILWKQIVWP